MMNDHMDAQPVESEQFDNIWLVKFLRDRGWEVGEGSLEGLEAVSSQGLVHCVDGRVSELEKPKMMGPKIQGGVLGVMALGIGRGDESAVVEACKRIKGAGYVPSVHGDEEHGEAGCGFGKLWRGGELDNLPKLEVSLERVKEIVLEQGGEYVPLQGGHEEKLVGINLVKGKTRAPMGPAFHLDAWVAEELGIDVKKLAENAVETVEKLNGPKVAQVMMELPNL